MRKQSSLFLTLVLLVTFFLKSSESFSLTVYQQLESAKSKIKRDAEKECAAAHDCVKAAIKQYKAQAGNQITEDKNFLPQAYLWLAKIKMQVQKSHAENKIELSPEDIVTPQQITTSFQNSITYALLADTPEKLKDEKDEDYTARKQTALYNTTAEALFDYISYIQSLVKSEANDNDFFTKKFPEYVENDMDYAWLKKLADIRIATLLKEGNLKEVNKLHVRLVGKMTGNNQEKADILYQIGQFFYHKEHNISEASKHYTEAYNIYASFRSDQAGRTAIDLQNVEFLRGHHDNVLTYTKIANEWLDKEEKRKEAEIKTASTSSNSIQNAAPDQQASTPIKTNPITYPKFATRLPEVIQLGLNHASTLYTYGKLDDAIAIYQTTIEKIEKNKDRNATLEQLVTAKAHCFIGLARAYLRKDISSECNRYLDETTRVTESLSSSFKYPFTADINITHWMARLNQIKNPEEAQAALDDLNTNRTLHLARVKPATERDTSNMAIAKTLWDIYYIRAKFEILNNKLDNAKMDCESALTLARSRNFAHLEVATLELMHLILMEETKIATQEFSKLTTTVDKDEKDKTEKDAKMKALREKIKELTAQITSYKNKSDLLVESLGLNDWGLTRGLAGLGATRKDKFVM